MEWISAKDEPPPINTKVLLCNNLNEVFEGEICVNVKDYNRYLRFNEMVKVDYGENEYKYESNITHWMPLPKPPKKQ